MKYYVAKVWFNQKANKFFGLSHNYHDLIVDEHKEVVLDTIASHYEVPVEWEHDSLTQITRGTITT
jgi:hypothetical protein